MDKVLAYWYFTLYTWDASYISNRDPFHGHIIIDKRMGYWLVFSNLCSSKSMKANFELVATNQYLCKVSIHLFLHSQSMLSNTGCTHRSHTLSTKNCQIETLDLGWCHGSSPMWWCHNMVESTKYVVFQNDVEIFHNFQIILGNFVWMLIYKHFG
jgi:hypothetical protein